MSAIDSNESSQGPAHPGAAKPSLPQGAPPPYPPAHAPPGPSAGLAPPVALAPSTKRPSPRPPAAAGTAAAASPAARPAVRRSPPIKPEPPNNTWLPWTLLALLSLSLVFYFWAVHVGIGNTLYSDLHQFRQTQNAITCYYMLKQGFTLK